MEDKNRPLTTVNIDTIVEAFTENHINADKKPTVYLAFPSWLFARKTYISRVSFITATVAAPERFSTLLL